MSSYSNQYKHKLDYYFNTFLTSVVNVLSECVQCFNKMYFYKEKNTFKVWQNNLHWVYLVVSFKAEY